MSRSSSPVKKENRPPVNIKKTRSASSTSTKLSRKPYADVAKSVKVVLRIKPDDLSTENNFAVHKGPDGKDNIVLNNEYSFSFDTVLSPSSTQEDTYNAVIENSVDYCLQGYRVCVLAYGQTGSGKTYSITGAEGAPGILPLFATKLFDKVLKDDLENKIFVSICFYEIYQEKVYDLLSSDRKVLRVRGGDDAHIDGLIEVGINDINDLERWRRIGLSRRATAATLINDLSSRSHAIFCIKVQREAQGDDRIFESKCFFVDLAGSERLSTTGDHHVTETVAINKSLLALQRVVDARISNASFVGYRDSVLTRLLKDCFSGNSLTTLLATMSSRDCYLHETLNTLRFSSKAARITQTPYINEVHGIENISILKEENEIYARRIAEMAAQIENLKQHSAVVDRIQAPSVLELFQDQSLNRWTRLEDGYPLSIYVGQPLAKLFFKNGKWSIHAFSANVAVDGNYLACEERAPIIHGTTVSLFGHLFFAFYLDNRGDPRKFVNYDRAKLQHVEASFEREKRKMNEQAVEDAKQSEKELRSALELEVKNLRNQVQVLQKKGENLGGSEKQAMRKEWEVIESQILDAEEVQKNLTAALNKESLAYADRITDATESEEAKARILDLQGKVSMINHLMEITGKSKVIHFRLNSEKNVRIFNRKTKSHADISYEEFPELTERFTEIYQSGKNKAEMVTEIERIIYTTRFVWKHNGIGHGSDLLRMATFNSLQETARKRRSTFAEITNGFASRRSIIADVIQQQAPATDSLEEFMRQVALFAVEAKRDADSVDELNKLTALGIMLKACGTARKHFETFLAESFFSATSCQKKASSLVGLFRSLASIEVISSNAQMCYISPEVTKSGIEYLVREILEHTNLLRQLVDAWINAIQNNTLSGTEGAVILSELNRIVENLGQYAFMIGQPDQCEDQMIQKAYENGVIKAVEEFTCDVENILITCAEGKTSKQRLKKLAATFVAELCKDVQSNYNEEFIFQVLRRAIFIKEQMSSALEDQAESMTPKIEGIISAAAELKVPLDPKITEMLNQGLKLWKDLASVAAKPPLIPFASHY